MKTGSAESVAEAKELLRYLERFITPDRSARMDAVLAERTRYATVLIEDIYQVVGGVNARHVSGVLQGYFDIIIAPKQHTGVVSLSAQAVHLHARHVYTGAQVLVDHCADLDGVLLSTGYMRRQSQPVARAHVQFLRQILRYEQSGRGDLN